MRAWLSQSQIRQRPMLAVYAGLLILIALVIGAAALSRLTSSSPDHDRLAVIGNLLSLGTLLLALVAGIVALAAYSAATGLPRLRIRLRLPGEIWDNVCILTEYAHTEENGTKKVTAQCPVSFAIKNESKYAARSPAVLIEFKDVAIRPQDYTESSGWIPTERAPLTGSVIAVQWDGGPNYAIHGSSVRHLPELNLRGLHTFRVAGRPRMLIRVLADGYDRDPVPMSVEFTGVPQRPALAANDRPKAEWL